MQYSRRRRHDGFRALSIMCCLLRHRLHYTPFASRALVEFLPAGLRLASLAPEASRRVHLACVNAADNFFER